MASRMLHYTIALEMMKSMDTKDKNRFLVGALLPDASSHQDGSYNEAHFYDELQLDILYKGVNWKRFAEKYADRLWTDDLYLGYLCHLIMDAIWFHDIADKYVRIYPYPARKDMYQKGYGDFDKLNVILRKEFNLSNPGLKIEDITIEEVRQELLTGVYDGFERDFAQEGNWCGEDLELYPYEALVEYMEKCKRICVGELEALKRGSSFAEPKEYFSKY